MHRLTTVALLGCLITCIALGAPAAEIAQSRNTQNSIANRLNHKQLSEIKREQFSPAAVGSPQSARLDTNFTEIGICSCVEMAATRRSFEWTTAP
jgi:hypothetical protein